jgi:hypothetical protein
MGRNRGYLALMAGIAGGAEVVVVPEIETTPDAIAHELRAASNRAGPIAIPRDAAPPQSPRVEDGIVLAQIRPDAGQ